MGHSSGGHIEVEFLKHYCDLVKGQILFSPVDGVDPFGLIDEYTITPGQVSAVQYSTVQYSTPSPRARSGLSNKQKDVIFSE